MTARPPIGVVLVNLGTPDEPTPRAVRRYLREFLWDPCVVDANRVLWWLILHLVILPRRPRRSAELYRRVWTPEGSPLLVAGRRAAEGLKRALGPEFAVRLGMRIGNPGLAAALDELRALGCRRVVLVPLYPQYSGTTTGSVERHVAQLGRRRPFPFELVTVPPFPEDRGYLSCIADRVRETITGFEGAHLVLSFHGIPVRYSEAGDPYAEHCRASAVGIAEELGLAADEWTMVFQSRFGREPWLEPYAQELVPALAKRHARVVVACPGFAADCLETIDEIGHELAAAFRAAGGEELRLVPGLNGDEDWVRVLATLVHDAMGTPTTP